MDAVHRLLRPQVDEPPERALVEGVGGDQEEPSVAGLAEALVEVFQPFRETTRVGEAGAQVVVSPDPRRHGPDLPGDLDGGGRGRDRRLALELDHVQAGQPDVDHRQVLAGPVRLQRLARLFQLRAGEVEARALPAGDGELDPEMGGAALGAGRLQPVDACRQPAPRLGDLAVLQAGHAQPALQLGLLEVALDVLERLGVDLGRVLGGISRLRLLGGLQEEGRGRAPVARRQQVPADLDRRRPGLSRQRRRRRSVEAPAAGSDQVVLDGIAGERVTEPVEPELAVGLFEQLGGDRGLQRVPQLLCVETGHGGQALVAEALAENGRRLQDLHALAAQALDPRQHAFADGLRQQPLLPSLPAGVAGSAEQLLDQVRIALGTLQDRLQGGRSKTIRTNGGPDHRAGLDCVQRLQPDDLDLVRPLPAPNQLPERVVAPEVLRPAGGDQDNVAMKTSKFLELQNSKSVTAKRLFSPGSATYVHGTDSADHRVDVKRWRCILG